MTAEENTYILIVEDEPEIADLIRFHVEREGLKAKIVHSGRIAMSVIERDPPMLVVLDLMLPDLDGLEVCRRLKWEAKTRQIPVLIVSAKGEESDVITGIELGADDYVTKPFSPKVLLARLKNILRRRHEHTSGATGQDSDEIVKRINLANGELVIDLDRHVVLVDGAAVDLTLSEFGILHYLAERPGFVRTRDQIIKSVHGDDRVLSSRTIDVHVTALRRKLGRLGSMIETVRGVGYRLAEPSSLVSAGD
jgi:two-component system, OmpR family, alkaline phosphatase synthesis response regulator PhoP